MTQDLRYSFEKLHTVSVIGEGLLVSLSCHCSIFVNERDFQRCCLQSFKQELLDIPLLWGHCSKSESWDWINRLSFLDRRPHESLHLYTQRLIVIVQENNFHYLSSCFINLVSTCMIPSHHRPFREHSSCVLYEPSCAAAQFYFIPTVWNKRLLLSIMCFGFVIDPCVSLRTAGKLPGCSVWALCPCLDLHAVKFSGLKHPCDIALFLASLAHLQEMCIAFEGGKTQS